MEITVNSLMNNLTIITTITITITIIKDNHNKENLAEIS